MTNTETQKNTNQAEWENPENWGGPKLLAIYFSKKDSRTWVPKQNPSLGWTLNLARTSGVLWLWSIITAACLTFVFIPFMFQI